MRLTCSESRSLFRYEYLLYFRKLSNDGECLTFLTERLKTLKIRKKNSPLAQKTNIRTKTNLRETLRHII